MSIKILHIEDNHNNRILVQQVLASYGYQVVEAVDGLSGIEMAKSEKPALILMDINIPGMDGYEAATRIKSMPELSHVPVIALTAKVMAGDRERALAAGCDGYIPKPIDVDALPAQIAEFLGGMREMISAEEESAYLREYNERVVERLEEKVKELTAMNESLVHSDAMKTRFINLAAHELRTPLATIHGYLTLLTSPDSKLLKQADDTSRELLDGLATGVDRLRGIVQDMLDMSRIQLGSLQLSYAPTNLSDILEKIEREFTPTVEKREQTLHVEKINQVLWADGERVTQILRNLVSNAIKYTPNNGTISIHTELVEDSRTLELVETSLAQFVKISVRDTGIGVDPEQQESIFETFYEVRDFEQHSTSKTDFMGGGTGLGLPIARGVAEAHGGSLWVESPGHDPDGTPGSTFHLILPIGRPQ